MAEDAGTRSEFAIGCMLSRVRNSRGRPINALLHPKADIAGN
jgi:hypothetical protein